MIDDIFRRHVVNGEILSLSLLLEDVLMFGPPNMSLEADEDANQQQLPNSSASKRSISIRYVMLMNVTLDSFR